MRRLAFGFAALSLAGCAPGAPDEAEVSGKPTFVSLNPCLDALLVEVAEPGQILALSHYSIDPSASSIAVERARQIGITGGSAEEVLALEPDIVLASTFIAPSTRAAFERLGLRVETFDSPATVAESVEQVRRLAGLAGDVAAGEALVQAIARPAHGSQGRRAISTLLWQPGQIVPGETTLIGELLRESGFASHSAERGLHQGDYVALETLLVDPPELLLVAGSSAGQRHPMLARMRGTQVEPLDQRLLFCGGPTIIDVRRRLVEVREAIERRDETPTERPLQARREGAGP
ncbi:ABC transporter substrate-binding protein [Erythrobacter sp. JK5]|nr:ABC transporter substrate-binding protein [Erythrobacter sp. JK5]